jgi:DNA-binding transcriptional LysR family regulator
MVSDCVSLAEGELLDAIQNSEQGVQTLAHDKIADLLDRVNWSDLHIMRSVADATSLRRAAQDLGMSVNTVRARVARLEASLGTVVFARSRDGLRITAEGRSVLHVANEMRSASTRLPHGQGNNVLVKDGEIRICASEGVGTFWLTPKLLELKEKLPNLIVSLDSYSDQSRLRLNEHDVSVGFDRPTDQDAIVTKLATLHFMPFASDQYLRERGIPASLDDMAGHQCVQQEAPGMNYDAMRFFFSADMMRQLVAIRVSSSYSLYWAVASGVGIGALPTYARAISRRVQPLDLPIRLKFELWLSYGQAAKASQPVRHTIQWLRACFDPVRYPWFSEHFVHPNDFGDPFPDAQVIPIFDHLVDDQFD